ncbi:MAG: hypothetical protein LAQ30_30290, partial [Acidobacteriia bacterium]|nr:hypothetical protein [Terriglobia bacterium]
TPPPAPTRSAIREVGKAFGIPEIALDHCAKLLPHWDGNLEAVFTEAGLDLPPHLRDHMARLKQATPDAITVPI